MMTATTYECIHVPEETFEFIEETLDGSSRTEIVRGLCALCGRWYHISASTYPIPRPEGDTND